MTMRVDFCPHCEPTAAGHAPGCPYEVCLPGVVGKDMEPVNHTFFIFWSWNPETGEGSKSSTDVFYKDCPNFEHMPDVMKASETEAEHTAWWAWYREQGEVREGWVE